MQPVRVDARCRRLSERLQELGFKKRSGLVFTLPLPGEDVFGWLGVNTATRKPTGQARLHPVVGVRHQAVERMVADLCAHRFHGYAPPSVSCPLYYLVDPARLPHWVLVGDDSDEDRAVVDDVAEAVMRDGVAFMQSAADLPGLLSAIRAGHGFPQQNSYRVPVALFLEGRLDEARQAVSSELMALDGETWPAAQDFRAFAQRFDELANPA
jgi:hypothetical protein